MRYDPERTKVAIMQLRELVDPIALMATIGTKTRYGRKPGPSAWHYTEELLRSYERSEDAVRVIAAFQHVGIIDEVDAGVWLAENIEAIE